MRVYLEGQQRAYEMPPGPADALPPYYWRALTYDDYTGRGWRTGETVKVTYRAGEPITSTTTAHRTLRQTVEAVGNLGGLLYAAGELVTADQDYSVAWRSHHDAFGAEIEAPVYRADSLVPFTSEAQLRSAGNDYPDWVRERYLALPPEVPPRVLALAHDLTLNAHTSYDQARAFETYLRAFTYTLDLPAPPPNREVADFFLFDLQQGYCDYYATTMVVLARAGGLPARLVVGYASGTYDSANARYVVTAADAHSWVEIYFPEIGWVEFEPTGGRPPIVRPAETAPAELAQALPPLNPITDRWAVLGKLGLLGTLIGLAVLGSALLVWWKADSWRLRRLPPAAVADKLYQRLYRHGRLLAVPAGAGDTPYEFAEGLTERVAELAQDRQLGETSTSTNQDVHWLTDLYVQGLYSPHKPTTAHRSQAIKTWQRLRRRMWLAWIWQTTRRKNGSEE
jgi:transglutaminase-like putative cysteine protease